MANGTLLVKDTPASGDAQRTQPSGLNRLQVKWGEGICSYEYTFSTLEVVAYEPGSALAGHAAQVKRILEEDA